jgi:hypothetical protein
MGMFDDEDYSVIIQKQIDDKISEGVDDQTIFEALDSDFFKNMTIEYVEEIAPELLQTYKSDMVEMLQETRGEIEGFEVRLYDLWKKPIDLLEMFIILSFETGEKFNEEVRPIAASKNDLIFEATIRLHARALLTAKEILVLLKSGYASGAHARWRTLHEIAVTTLLISKHGQNIAERYLLHDYVESCRAAFQYQKYATRLGREKYSTKELNEYRRLERELKTRFGDCYFNTYGWASEVLNKCNPTFTDLEKDVNLDHMRPYYKLASHAVHSSPKGITFNMGLSAKYKGLNLGGPSNEGLTDPGHSTAISLQQINKALLSYKVSLKGTALLKAFSLLVNEIGDAFLSIHQKQTVD